MNVIILFTRINESTHSSYNRRRRFAVFFHTIFQMECVDFQFWLGVHLLVSSPLVCKLFQEVDVDNYLVQCFSNFSVLRFPCERTIDTHIVGAPSRVSVLVCLQFIISHQLPGDVHDGKKLNNNKDLQPISFLTVMV